MTRAELRWASCWAVGIMLITCLPYLYVARFAPPGTTFLGFLSVADDHCVYLSWEEQAAQGHFLLRNLFTGDAQRGIYIHLLSWFIGTMARFTGLPLVLVHHAARCVAGTVLLVLIYALFARFTVDVATRRAAFWMTACSSGLGCLFLWKKTDQPVDLWQPEAITFLCLYVNGLFCASLALMVGFLLLLLAAEGRQGRERWSRVAGAGLLGLLLGNIHSYDVITLGAIWVAYLVARTLTSGVRGQGSGVRGQDCAGSQRSTPGPRPLTPTPRPLTPGPCPFSPGRALVDALVAGLIACPSIAYQYYLYCTEPVFRQRADSPTLTPPILYYLEGYGLILLLATVGLIGLSRVARRQQEPLGERLLPMVWAVVGFALPYLPLPFQRKLLIGLHLPLAFLAAVGAVALARWVAHRSAGMIQAVSLPTAGHAVSLPGTDPRQAVSLPHSRLATAIVAGLLLLTMPTNWCFIRRDIAAATKPTEDRNELPAFIPKVDLEAMRWAQRHLAPNGTIFCSAVSGRLFPALSGRPVYVGHWSETPQANDRMLATVALFSDTHVSSDNRRGFLEERNIRYLYCGSFERKWGNADFDREPYLYPLYRGKGTALYEFRPRQAAVSARDRRPRLTPGEG